MSKRLILSIFVFCIFFIQASSIFADGEDYTSHCINPKFSPDEKLIAYWDTEICYSGYCDYALYLKLYNIEKKSVKRISKNVIISPSAVYWSEILMDFLNLAWSPDGNYLAFSLNGEDVDVLDVRKMEIISRMSFRKNLEDQFIGYYYIHWNNNETITVGYMSHYAKSLYTDDTYGLIVKKNGKFVIEKGVLENDSEFNPDPDTNFESQYKPKDRCYSILRFDKNGEIQLRTKYLQPDRRDFIFEYIKPNSGDWIVVTVSNTAKWAIIGSSEKKAGKFPTYKLDVKLIPVPLVHRIPLMFCVNFGI